MPPYREDPQRVTYFAETDARGKKVRFGIKAIDRLRHMYIIGKTGMGKSTLLENLAIQDIQNGEGLAFIDPHGSTAERLLEYVPEERIKDVLYIAPFDIEHPVGFNVMEDVGYDKRHLVVSGLMSAFHRIWEDAWSARMEYILTNTLLALLEYPDSTLLDVNRMYSDKGFRKKVVEYITDPIVKRFWAEEFAGYSDRYTQDATPAIQNKVGQFTSNPLVRNIIGQAKSSFDIRKMMDERKILIVNLSKGRIGETNANLLGSMLTTKIYLSAMSRADLPSAVVNKLPSFYFYVDEFQSVANDSFADILSEARKYKLALVIAHQYIKQMEENVENAVFGNVGTTIAFRVGPFDAETLETVFQPQFMAADLVNLGFAQIYLTLMIDGIGSPPFSAKTLTLIAPPRLSYADHVIENTRKVYGRPRAQVEADIAEHGKVIEPEKPAAKAGGNNGPVRERREGPPRENSAPRPRVEQVPPRPAPRPMPQAETAPAAPPQPALSLKDLLRQKTGEGVAPPKTSPSQPSATASRQPDPRTQNIAKDATPEKREELRSILANLSKSVQESEKKKVEQRKPPPAPRPAPQEGPSVPPRDGVAPEELRKLLRVDGDK